MFLRKRWQKLSERVSPDEQEDFLRESFGLFRTLPFYYIPFYIVMILLVLYNVLVGRNSYAFVLGVLLLLVYVVNLLVFFSRFKRFEKEYL